MSKILTDTPGSSEWFEGSIISYSNALKTRIGVNEETLLNHGAVSENTAVEMAKNTKDLINAIDLNIIKGAALDVLEYEPSSFDPFLEVIPEKLYNKLKNNYKIILTPHVAGWTKESYFKLSNVLANKVLNHYQK